MSSLTMTVPSVLSGPSVDYKRAEDLELARMAAHGDMTAFEELYQRHHRKTYSLCLRMMDYNPTQAEDLTQEVFIQLFRKVGSFKGDSKFSTWFHRMTVNQVLMHYRKRSVKYEKTVENEEAASHLGDEKPVPGTDNPARLSMDHKIALEDAINGLPQGYKNVFILHDVEGFEHEEVARILGCSIGTSKSQLHKARLKLRKLLNQKANPRLVGV